jgi:hypothetical protein
MRNPVCYAMPLYRWKYFDYESLRFVPGANIVVSGYSLRFPALAPILDKAYVVLQVNSHPKMRVILCQHRNPTGLCH